MCVIFLLVCTGTLKQGDKGQATTRDYESLKMQCEKAMAEVQGLLK